MKSNTIELKVNWGDTDAAGIVFYPNYFRWFDIATHEYFCSIGLPIKELSKQNIVTPILTASNDFKKPLYYDDAIKVTSTITEVKTKTFRIEHQVQRGEEVTGTGFEWRAWVLNDSGHLGAVPIPKEILALFNGGFPTSYF